jgi:hypothetical protein
MTEAEQAAYERGRADERADVVAWLREPVFNLGGFWIQIVTAWRAFRCPEDLCQNVLRNAANGIARREHMKGTDNAGN